MNYYIATSIPYANGEPHIGHVLEFLMADVLARTARAQGKAVIFSTGSDEHGSKVAEKAEELKVSPKELSDTNSQNFRDVCKLLNVSNNRFIRTTDAGHEQRAQFIWKALANDIYKSAYEGLYCVGCEEFVTQAVAQKNKGRCPEHHKPYEKIKEENYFFKLSKYNEPIQTAIKSGSFRVIPATRKHEILQLIADGLEDISISRPRDKISWGIPVPDDDTQVMYVWFEALMNYITVLGYPEHDDFKKFWPANVQVIGKGIIRQHAAIWPGILLGLGLPLPRTLFVHGYVTVEDKKIGKSLGNAIHPREIVERYGVDAYRYYFLRYIPSYEDGDFSWKRFDIVYNNELANDLGNLVQRTAAMITKYQNGIIGLITETTHDRAQYDTALQSCRFDRALDAAWEQVRGLNQYIDQEKPWELPKRGETEHLREVLAYQVACLLEIADLLGPFMPETAEKIKASFKEGVVRPIEGTLFPKKDVAEPGPKVISK